MQHLAVKAAVAEVTDLGQFEALAATYEVDRVKDRIIPGAFENTIAAWQQSAKLVPVHWAHGGEAKDIIGAIDSAEMREIPGQGLFVKGKLDLEGSEVAREAWRSMKNNAVSLSFGYLTVKSRKRNGVNELLELDLFEISVAPGPVNPQTRFLTLKATAEPTVPTDAQLRAEAKRLGVELPLTRTELRRKCDEVALEAALGWEPAPKVTSEPPRRVATEAELRRQADTIALDRALGWDPPPRPAEPEAKAAPPTEAELRAQAAELGLALPPGRRAAKNVDFDAIKNQARDEMVALFRAADEQAGHR